MRKTLLVLLLVAAVLSSAFAAKDSSVMLGLSSGYSQLVSFHENADSTSMDIVPVKADALFYLGDSFALNVALGMDIYLPEIDGADAQTGFVADILAYYRLKAGDSFDILLGGGMSYRNQTERGTGEGNTTSESVNMLDLMASLRLQIAASDHLGIFAGADVGYNIMNKATFKADSISIDVSPKNVNIMPWAVKAGINYRF